MRADRSATQILHGFLPGQTVDLHAGIWKVSEWRDARYIKVDDASLRRELIRLAGAWEAAGTDGKFVQKLRSNQHIRPLGLDRMNGVLVDRFPEIWQCRSCNRIARSRSKECRCGRGNWGQLPFVAYHECGRLEEPYVPRCKTHDDVRIVFPGSTDASKIKFVCPECGTLLRQGFGFAPCECGQGPLKYNVHRAGPVFTPRSVAIVNPVSPERREELKSSGGAERALAWVLDGLEPGGLGRAALDRSELVEKLVADGFDRTVAEQMATIAAEGDQVANESPVARLGSQAALALDTAVTIVNALSESRTRVRDLIERTAETSPVGSHYRSRYPVRLARAGLEELELIERFPVLTGNFGFTRGDSAPGASRLVTFRDRKTHGFVVYADLQETEALFFRLDPQKVHEWLTRRGHGLPAAATPREARLTILEHALIPDPGGEVDAPTLGSDALTLVHSLAHRTIRQGAVLAGIDRNSLAELLVPAHLGFFVYAAARGGFVLGGLQAVFETELDRLLDAMVRGEHRCALDPGCAKGGGACVACLHLGEPSCRYFNRFLDRRALWGPTGYFTKPVS